MNLRALFRAASTLLKADVSRFDRLPPKGEDRPEGVTLVQRGVKQRYALVHKVAFEAFERAGPDGFSIIDFNPVGERIARSSFSAALDSRRTRW